MCGIIGATSSRTVEKILVKGLKKMEYRGYDSAGLVLNQIEGPFQLKKLGKVSGLEAMITEKKTSGKIWNSSYPLGNTWRAIRN